MPKLEIKPTHKPVQTHYAALRQFDDLGVPHKGAVKSAFRSLSASNGERTRLRCRSEFLDFAQKQQFLNTVYKTFLQGYAVEQTDTLGSKCVRILDAFVGTGNFIVNDTPEAN